MSIAITAGCPPGAIPPPPATASSITSPAELQEYRLETAPGLSGLAIDDRGVLWTVAERARTAYRIELSATREPALDAYVIHGIPPGRDLEAVAILADGRLVFGTESGIDGVAEVLIAERRAHAFYVTHTFTLTFAEVGMSFEGNHGAEGVCAVESRLFVAFEASDLADGRRWAPVLELSATTGAVVARHRLWLTSERGKISALDCRRERDPGGARNDPEGLRSSIAIPGIELLAIERHFEVTKLLTFRIAGTTPSDLTPHVTADLAPLLRGRLNLEGVVWWPDGSALAVVDNQWKTITGPSELVWIPARLLR